MVCPDHIYVAGWCQMVSVNDILWDVCVSPTRITQGCAHIRKMCSRSIFTVACWELVPLSLSLLCLSLSGVRVKIKEPPCSAKQFYFCLYTYPCCWTIKKKGDQANACWFCSFISKLCIQSISIILGAAWWFSLFAASAVGQIWWIFLSLENEMCFHPLSPWLLPAPSRVSSQSLLPSQGWKFELCCHTLSVG